MIAANLAAVRARVNAAAQAAGRDPSDIRLVAVSKTFGLDRVREAYDAGQHDFGENRVQEALQKIDDSAELEITWHLIGHLQSNKARKAASAFGWIQSIDGVDLLRKVDQAAADAGVAPTLLIQVDLAGEATKRGASADELAPLIDAGHSCRAARLAGLMLLPPWLEDPEAVRPYFRRLRDLRDELLVKGTPSGALRELSMGMSHDFEVAIQEGATLVRVGTAIFGKRSVKT